jgi:hypothetical protein
MIINYDAAGESAPDLAYRLAFENEPRYDSCGQVVLKALVDVFDLNLRDLLKAFHPPAAAMLTIDSFSEGPPRISLAGAGGIVTVQTMYSKIVN